MQSAKEEVMTLINEKWVYICALAVTRVILNDGNTPVLHFFYFWPYEIILAETKTTKEITKSYRLHTGE